MGNNFVSVFSLVGEFMAKWAIVERRIDNAIAEALGLDYPQKLVICTALSTYKKLEALKTLIGLAFPDGDDKKRFLKLMRKLSKIKERRNALCHRLLSPTNDGTALILVQEKLKGGDTSWEEKKLSTKEFFKDLSALDELIEEMNVLERKIKQDKPLRRLLDVLSESKRNPFAGLQELV